MKKFLFTLATIVAFGFAADAYTIDFSMVGPSTYDAAKQEISIAPSGNQTARRQTFHFKVGNLDMPVIGWQVAYRLYDPDGNILGPDAPVHIRAVGGQYFRKENSGPSALPENAYSNNYDEAEQWYMGLGANLTYGVVWELADWLEIDFGSEDAFYDEIGGTEAMLTYPANVIQFQVEVDEGWDYEYVTFDFVDSKFKTVFYDTHAVTEPDFAEGYFAGCDFKVINADFSSTKEIAGTVELGALNDGFDVPVTINMTDPTEGYVVAVTVNDETATIENGIIVLPDVAGEYVVNVTITADGYEGKVTANQTYTIEQAKQPVITFTEGETGVTIDVEDYTSYEVIVDGVNMGQINFVEEGWAEQTVEVNATNAPAGYLPATASNQTTVGVKDNYTLAGDITIGAVDENGMIYVTYTGNEEVTLTATANGEAIAVVDGYITLPDYGEYEIVVTATPTAEHTDALVSDPATRVWSAPQVYDVVPPTVAGEQTATEYVINVTNNDPYATVTLFVTVTDMEGVSTTTQYTEFPVKIARDENDYMISYYATATLTEAPAGYDDWTNASTSPKTDYIDALPTLKGEVTVTVDENGNVIATYDGNEEVTITVNPETLTEYGEDIPVTVTVTAEGYQDLVVNTTVDYTKPEAPKLLGELIISDHVDGAFTVTYTGDEEVTIECTITPKSGAKATTQGYNLPTYGTYEVYAKATAKDAAYEGDFVEATRELVWEAPANKDFQGTVTVTVDDNGNVTAVYNAAEGETVTPNVTVNPSHLDNYGEDIPVTVTVTAEGYNDKTFNETVDYTKPAPTEKTDAPSSKQDNYVYKDKTNGVYYNAVTVTLTQPETSDNEEYEIYYRIGVLNPETGQYDYPETYTLYENPFNVTSEGTYMVDAYAVAKDMLDSDHISVGFQVSVATSIEELFADKAVANVRYFNMAGQEMQQANGICITVYTFTDGTQVAVKVMK